MRFNTGLLHNGYQYKEYSGAISVPVFPTTAFAQDSAEDLGAVFEGKAAGFAYTRISNPTVIELERRLNFLEKGISASACSSGMAAISVALMNMLESGDEIIAGSGLFGGTLDFFADLKDFGIKTNFVDDFTPDEIEKQINTNTKAIFVEIVGNPCLKVVNVREVADLAHANGIPLITDSTSVTPYLMRPVDFGADIVIHSLSKYINGSGNAIGGVIIDGGNFQWNFAKHKALADYKKYGKLAYTAKLKSRLLRDFGSCLSPMNAYNCIVGLETLGLRMERLCENAYKLAKALSGFKGIRSVNYPSLESNSAHGLVKNQFTNGYGGAIVTIRCGAKEKAYTILNNLKYAYVATNIGDVKTLVIHPASTIFLHSTEQEKQAAGVYDDLIRISVGLEDAEDLIDDFKQAVEKTLRLS